MTCLRRFLRRLPVWRMWTDAEDPYRVDVTYVNAATFDQMMANETRLAPALAAAVERSRQMRNITYRP